ncbi:MULTISPECIES: hypothetical protein [unclassified Streptomyces]|uniref:hypothetical protein n=1 Tax=unclassified Streptomyces TaxID=2593676 RepID=UPI000A4BAAC5|nr:hypothetical protein [Streptomyces sp. TSRI0281]
MSNRFPKGVIEALTATGWHDGIRIPEDEFLCWYRALGAAGIDLPPSAMTALRDSAA